MSANFAWVIAIKVVRDAIEYVEGCGSPPKVSAVKTIDWPALRKDFPILDQKVHGKPLIYFDNAATLKNTRLSRSVKTAATPEK